MPKAYEKISRKFGKIYTERESIEEIKGGLGINRYHRENRRGIKMGMLEITWKCQDDRGTWHDGTEQIWRTTAGSYYSPRRIALTSEGFMELIEHSK